MSESFVDVTYRGLSLARRVKLAQVRPTTGYLEAPQPMPVGSTVAIITDDTVALDATVIAIHEQVGGSDVPPGMLVRPRLEGDAALTWWRSRVTLPDLEPTSTPYAPGAVPAAPIVVVQKRVTNPGMGIPSAAADAHDTGVMDAVDPALLEAAEVASRDTLPRIGDDGKATIAMDAVDLAALGLETPAETSSDDDDKPDKSGTRKRRKKTKG